MTSLACPSGNYREKLEPERLAEMREMVEGTTLSLRQIAEALRLSASTISRYARHEGWQRPAGPPDPPAATHAASASDRRKRLTEKLWRLAERHAEELEEEPISRAGRSLQPLARLTRTLGEIDKRVQPPAPPDDDYPDIKKPKGRTIHELRDELAAHLERIQREEGYGWEVREWWFWDGGGI